MSEGKRITAKNAQKGILYVDSREPNKFAELLAKQCTIPLKIRQLETCDYLCEDVCIERKEINDFAVSLMSSRAKSGRLWTQTERMLKEFRHSYVLVSGIFQDLTVKIHRHAILGALARILANGISVIFGLETDEDFTYLALKIFEKHRKLWLVPPKKPKKKKRKKPKKKTEVFVGLIK